MYEQTFEAKDLLVVWALFVLECVLSIDNALVLGLLAKRVRPDQQSRVLTFGLVGAFLIRLVAVLFVQYVMAWSFVKVIGGTYLIYVAAKYFWTELRGHSDESVVTDESGNLSLVDPQNGQPFSNDRLEEEIESRTIVPVPPLEATGIGDRAGQELTRKSSGGYAGFWQTVLVVELTDLAFAVDSILAGVAMVGDMPKEGMHPKLWVVYLGGILGIISMRFTSMIFIRLLNRFPRFEVSAYLLIVIIGSKLLLEWYFNSGTEHRLDFHSLTSPAFYLFWSLMLGAFLIGFIRPENANKD